jgi:AcrR family transcriptional regulator
MYSAGMAYLVGNEQRGRGNQKPVPRRPRRIEKEQRQSEILDAAYELFAKKGFGATRIDDIAKEAHVAKGLVLFHFKSKEEVFQAVVRRAIPVLLDKLDVGAPKSGTDAADILRQALRQVYHHLVENPQAKVILQLLTAEGNRFPTLRAFYHSEVVARGNAVISRIVSFGVKQGKFSVKVDDNTPRILLGPLVSALFWQILFTEYEKIDIERLFESHIDLALHGLIRRRKPSRK